MEEIANDPETTSRWDAFRRHPRRLLITATVGVIALATAATLIASAADNPKPKVKPAPIATAKPKPSPFILTSLNVTDSISGAPITQATLAAGTKSATTDAAGSAQIELTRTTKTVGVTFHKDGYNDRAVTINPAAPPKAITMVPAGKVFFLSNRTGKVGVYSSNLDGSAQTAIVAPAENETGSPTLDQSPDNKWLVLQSTRDGDRDANGRVKIGLFLINTETNSVHKFEVSNYFDLLGWSGHRFVYLSHDPEGPQQLRTINAKTRQVSTLASFDNGVAQLVGDRVLYGSRVNDTTSWFSQSVRGGQAKHQIDASGSPYVIARTKAVIETYEGDKTESYLYDSVSDSTSELEHPPTDFEDKSGLVSADGKYAVVADNRDGKTDLFTVGAESQPAITQMGTVNSPVSWIGDDYIVFSSSETRGNAYYVVSRIGGKAHKIVDIYAPSNYGGE